MNYFFLCLPIVLFSQGLESAKINWIGTNGNWSDPTQWSGNVVPTYQDLASFSFDFSYSTVMPYTELDLAFLFQNSCCEKANSPFAASFNSKFAYIVKSETGLKFSQKWDYSNSAFYLMEKVAHIFEGVSGLKNIQSAFFGIPAGVTLTVINQNLNLGAVGIDFGCEFGKEKPIKLDIGYQGAYGAHYYSNQLNL